MEVDWDSVPPTPSPPALAPAPAAADIRAATPLRSHPGKPLGGEETPARKSDGNTASSPPLESLTWRTGASSSQLVGHARLVPGQASS